MFRPLPRLVLLAALYIATLGLRFAVAAPQPSAPTQDPRLAEAGQAMLRAGQLSAGGHYAEAKAAAQRAVDLVEAAVGKNAPQLAEPLSLLGDAVRMTGDVVAGEALQRKALALYDKAGAQSTPYYGSVLYRLADVLRMRGKFAEALQVQQQLGALYERLYGKQDLAALAVCLSAQAELHRLLGHTDQALPLHQRAIAMSQATNGPKHAYTASLMQAEATTWAARGEYPKAVKEFEEALAIMEATLGPDHMWVGQVAQNLGLELLHVGDLKRADQLYERALVIDRATLGPQHPFVAAVLTNQGDVALLRNRLVLAEEKLRQAYEIAEAAYGDEHPEVIAVAEHYARVLRETGRKGRAKAVLLQTLPLREKVQGKEHPDLVNSLIPLAELALDQGDVGEGEAYLARAERLVERAHGREHPLMVPILDLRARIDAAVDDTEHLVARRRLALKIHLAGNGAQHPNTASAQNNLADALLPSDPTQAVALLQTALTTTRNVFGDEHLRTATARGNLGAALAGHGDLVGAKQELLAALQLDQRLLGAEHPHVAADLYNLAMVDAKLGRLAQAESQMRTALAIEEKAWGPDNPQLVSVLWRLGDLLDARGQHDQALTLRARASGFRDQEMHELLWTGDEQRKVSLLTYLSEDTSTLLRHVLQFAPDNPHAAELALQTVLRRHGRTVEALADTLATLRQKLSSDDRKILDSLADSRSRLAAFAVRGPGDGDETAWHSAVEELKAEITKTEAVLAERSQTYRRHSESEATVQAVQATLSPEVGLLEYLVWTPTREVASGRWNEEKLPQRLAACVLRHKGAPRWFDLGELSAIEQSVGAARRALNKPSGDSAKAMKLLSEQLLAPIWPALAGAKRLRVAADGPLLVVPFAALPVGAGSPLIDTMIVSYLGSGRDLLHRNTLPSVRQPPLVLADPDFGPQVTPRDDDAGDLRSLSVAALPGTAAEAKMVGKLYPDAKVLLGDKARETALKSSHGPRFLHVATHGFFQSAGRAPGIAALKAPLVRSGLLLAGFNRHPVGADDGVLTALEAASLDLYGTELAVLSACNTGLGDLRSGDGVQGLRRALVIAGAQSVLMSLWSVDDAATAELMKTFYEHWKNGETRAVALQSAQRAVRSRPEWQHPYYWAAFVEAGAE